MTFILGCFSSVSKSGQVWCFPFSANLTSESGKQLYTKVLEDYLSFSKYKDHLQMSWVAQDITSGSYCTIAETLSGWILSFAILPKLKDRTQGGFLHESC